MMIFIIAQRVQPCWLHFNCLSLGTTEQTQNLKPNNTDEDEADKFCLILFCSAAHLEDLK